MVTPVGQRVGNNALDWWDWICTPYDRLSRGGSSDEPEFDLFHEIDAMEENRSALTVVEERWLRLMIGPKGVRYYMEERQGFGLTRLWNIDGPELISPFVFGFTGLLYEV